MVRNVTAHSTTLLDLPLELVGEILHHLHGQQLLRCAQVCRSIHDLVGTSVDLQYRIELWADGLVDGARCGLTTAERLALVRQRRRAWRALDYTRKVSVPMAGRCNAYELVGGVFAKTMDTTALAPGSRHLAASWLPTSDGDGRDVVREDVGLPTRDFAIDPTQDLIAFVESPKVTGAAQSRSPEVRVHLHSLSTNKPHPDAALTILTHNTTFSVQNAFIQIADDVVGFFFWGEGPGLIIWNWRTGRVMVSHISIQSDRDAWDFSFLSPRSYMLANLSDDGALDVYSFGARSAAPHTLAPSRVASLRLPARADGVALVNMSAHAAPFTARAVPGRPFSAAPDARIHAISLQYFQERTQAHRRYCLFVHNQTLLKYVTDWEQRAPLVPHAPGVAAYYSPSIAWPTWGPAATRVLPHHAPFQWLRYVHGTRVVLPPMALHDGPARVEQLVRVLDFGVRPGRKDAELEGADPVHPTRRLTKLFCETTEDAEGEVFARPVASRLPCLIVERQDAAYRYQGFMLDEERLVGLKSNAFSNGDMGDLDVFTF